MLVGIYDVPAFVDHVLRHNKHDQLSYIGHSQGSAQMFVQLSQAQSEISSKINLFVGLAPVAYIGHQTYVTLALVCENSI